MDKVQGTKKEMPDIKIRSLTRGEVKKLREEGFILAALTIEQIDDAMDKVFEIVLSAMDLDRLDKMPYSESIKVFKSIFEMSYGRDQFEVKN